MIAFISICYASLYFLIFNKLGLLKKSVGNICAFAGVGVALIGAIVFMWYTFSPLTSDARMFRFIIPIVPNVRGQVVEVPIDAKRPIAQGEVLFQIDPDPYEFTVRQLEAQVKVFEADLRLADINVERAKKLLEVQSAAQVDLDTWQAKADAARASIAATEAQLDKARWDLEETTVRAPYDGYVVNLQLRPGHVVTTIPAASPMAFVSQETNIVLSSFSQSSVRKISEGDKIEMVFTNVPGKVFSGEVMRIVGLGSQAQLSASGQLPTLTGAPATDRWGVLVVLDDEEFARQMPQGAGGTMAVYTSHGQVVHVISKVALRINAWLGYLTAP